MLKPPLPMTKTFFTSTGFAAPLTTPLSKYAFALGAVWVWSLRIVEVENGRAYLAPLEGGAWLCVIKNREEARVVNVLAGDGGTRS